MAPQPREHTANHARSRDPTLSQEEATIVATAFGARVCGTEGGVAGFESLGEVLERTEKNEMFLNAKLKELLDRVAHLEAEHALMLQRRDKLRLPSRRIGQ